MRATKFVSLVVPVAVVLPLLTLPLLTLPGRPAVAAEAKGAGALLGTLAGGTLNNVLGNEASSVLTSLGVFSMLGLGSGSDPVINAKLDQIINQLQVIQADVTDLKNDVATLTNTVVAQAALVQLQTLLHDMDDAQTSIQLCAQQVTLVAQAPGSDASDQQMQSFALQMVGREAGPCDLTNQFSIIHSRIVTDQTLGSAESAVYSLLAQVARNNGIAYEQIASHFVQYAITQREALELIRGAYSALGEPDNLQTVLTQAPSDFLGELHDEEVAFLVATDVYITGGPPPYDTSPAALADAIVQRLEGVHTQASSYSLSILDNATAFSPTLTPPAGSTATALPMSDAVSGVMESYYATGDTALTAGIGSCLATPPSDGFSYVRPFGGTRGGFKVGSSCALHLERHLLQNVPPQVTSAWTVARRESTVPVGPYTLRNAASLADETAAESLALAGGLDGRGSGYSSFTVTANPATPNVITLAIDVPGQMAAPVGVGVAHAFAAGAAAATAFTRVPFGAQYPDRYALTSGGMYLSIGSDGFAALAATPTYFDFQLTPDGHTELDYDGGVVYVDAQYQQLYFGESPDDVWANDVNLAVGTAAVSQWSVPADAIPRPEPTTSLYLYPPCINSAGVQGVAVEDYLGPALPAVDGSRCSSDVNGQTYVIYIATLTNQDAFDRALQLTVGALVSEPPSISTTTASGIHCYGGSYDHLDTGYAVIPDGGPSMTTQSGVLDITVPANGTLAIWCQALDVDTEPGQLTLDQFEVVPCQGAAGNTCMSYP